MSPIEPKLQVFIALPWGHFLKTSDPIFIHVNYTPGQKYCFSIFRKIFIRLIWTLDFWKSGKNRKNRIPCREKCFSLLSNFRAKNIYWPLGFLRWPQYRGNPRGPWSFLDLEGPGIGARKPLHFSVKSLSNGPWSRVRPVADLRAQGNIRGHMALSYPRANYEPLANHWQWEVHKCHFWCPPFFGPPKSKIFKKKKKKRQIFIRLIWHFFEKSTN